MIYGSLGWGWMKPMRNRDWYFGGTCHNYRNDYPGIALCVPTYKFWIEFTECSRMRFTIHDPGIIGPWSFRAGVGCRGWKTSRETTGRIQEKLGLSQSYMALERKLKFLNSIKLLFHPYFYHKYLPATFTVCYSSLFFSLLCVYKQLFAK